MDMNAEKSLVAFEDQQIRRVYNRKSETLRQRAFCLADNMVFL